MNGDGAKVVINLAAGLEDAERVTVAFLVGGAALEQGKSVAMFLTKEAVRLGLPGYAEGVACEGCPPLPRLFEQYADGGGELLVCPICFWQWGAIRSKPDIVGTFGLGRVIPFCEEHLDLARRYGMSRLSWYASGCSSRSASCAAMAHSVYTPLRSPVSIALRNASTALSSSGSARLSSACR